MKHFNFLWGWKVRWRNHSQILYIYLYIYHQWPPILSYNFTAGEAQANIVRDPYNNLIVFHMPDLTAIESLVPHNAEGVLEMSNAKYLN